MLESVSKTKHHRLFPHLPLHLGSHRLHRGDSDVLWYYCMSECSPLMWPLCRESCSLAQLLRWLAAEEAAAQARQRTAIAHQPAWVLNLALLGGDGGIT